MRPSGTAPVLGVYLCKTFDLKPYFEEVMDPRIRIFRPGEVERPEDIRFALCWEPASDAFARYPNIKLVSSIAAGVDSIVSCPSLPDDALVVRIRDDEAAKMMAGFAAWQVVWHHRQMGHYLARQGEQQWDRMFLPAPVGDVTVGILGFGLMGRAISRAVAAMGYPVIAACRSGGVPGEGAAELISGQDGVKRVATRANILINVLPLTEQTRDILDARLFARMPRGAALIQLGRGEHLVENDLLAALESGQLAGASLDVFRQEPLPAAHPFWSHPCIVVTPHKAGDAARQTIMQQLVEAVEAMVVSKAPANLINRRFGY